MLSHKDHLIGALMFFVATGTLAETLEDAWNSAINNNHQLPQVAVNGGYQYQENRYQAFEGMWMANVGMDWKLFDGSSGHRSDALTRQAISLKEQRDDLSSMIGLQVRQAWLDTQETQKRIAVTQQAIDQADENLKVTTDRYQQGLSTNTDVLKAEDLRTTTHGNFNNATYDAALATVHLRRAVGVL